MKKTKNETHIEGLLYEHSLENKISGEKSKNPGTEFISGTISIATDDDLLNVVPVHYTYVVATTKSGKPNSTYNTLQAIIDGKIGNVMEHGKENAGKLRVDSSIGLNEWFDYKTQGTPLVSTKRNEGGFVHQVQTLNEEVKTRATFNTDMLITRVHRVEADIERNLPEKVIVSGYIFDFRNAMMPVEYSVYEPFAPAQALDYFENIGASNQEPKFTRVQGQQVSKTVVRNIIEESAFGEPIVKPVTNTQKDYVITWALPGGYEWDSEDSILASEVTEKLANREVYLAELKKRSDEFQATRDMPGIMVSPTLISEDEYKF